MRLRELAGADPAEGTVELVCAPGSGCVTEVKVSWSTGTPHDEQRELERVERASVPVRAGVDPVAAAAHLRALIPLCGPSY